jgi:hypothetical protein
MAGTAAYLYCVVKSPTKPTSARVPAGLPDATKPQAVQAARSLWLIASDVPLETYGGSALEASLSNLEWVSDIALAHEAVVEHFASKDATVVPMKLFTMFSSVEKAAADIRARAKDINAVAKRIAGCEEWGVRITRETGTRSSGLGVRDSDRETGTDRATGTPRATVTTVGTSFLANKKRARDEARETIARALEAADASFDALSTIAREARRRDDMPAAAATPPLLDGAFLVPSAKRARFQAVAARQARACEAAGARLTVSGPWPAYNFVQTSGRTE